VRLADLLEVPERDAPLCDDAAAAGFRSNRAWAVAELRGLSRVNRALQAVLLQVWGGWGWGRLGVGVGLREEEGGGGEERMREGM
jgi:hypothetical protein